MKRDRRGCVVLEHPADYLEFTYRGVHVKRLTGLHEASRYTATVTRTGRTYTITGGHSKRLPWQIRDAGGMLLGGHAKLIDVAIAIGWYDSELPRPTRSATPLTSADHGRQQTV